MSTIEYGGGACLFWRESLSRIKVIFSQITQADGEETVVFSNKGICRIAWDKTIKKECHLCLE